MPISIRVPEGGLELPVMAPANVKPGFLYLVTLADGQPGPVVLARESQGEVQLGPLPPNMMAEQIAKVTELPTVKRVEVEGLLDEPSPEAMRVIEVMNIFGPSHSVVLHL